MFYKKGLRVPETSKGAVRSDGEGKNFDKKETLSKPLPLGGGFPWQPLRLHSSP